MSGMIEQNTSQIRCQWKWRTKWRVKTVCLQVGINVTTNKAPGRSGLAASAAAAAILLHAAKQEFHPICQCPKRGRWTKFPSLVLLDGCLISNSSCHYIPSRSFKWHAAAGPEQIECGCSRENNDLGTCSLMILCDKMVSNFFLLCNHIFWGTEGDLPNPKCKANGAKVEAKLA